MRITTHLLLFFCCCWQLLLGQIEHKQQSHSVVITEQIKSELMNTMVSYHVYQPEAYLKNSDERFPVIYWLHGSGGWPPGVLQMLAKRFDMAMNRQQIPPALVIFLDDGKRNSMWVDSKDGSIPMESVIMEELIPHIDQKFRTIPNGSGRVLEGGSMGGYGSARLAFKYPKFFGAVSMLNPGPMQRALVPEQAPLEGRAMAQRVLDQTYGGDVNFFIAQSPWQLAENNVKSIKKHLSIRMILGGQDPSLGNNQLFSQHLNRLNILHSTMIIEEAGHSPKAMFSALGDAYWTFFNDHFSKAKN